MASAKSRTQGKLDRRLESLGDKIAEQLSELSGNELQALTCWKDGIMPDTYEIDHDAITEKPRGFNSPVQQVGRCLRIVDLAS